MTARVIQTHIFICAEEKQKGKTMSSFSEKKRDSSCGEEEEEKAAIDNHLSEVQAVLEKHCPDEKLIPTEVLAQLLRIQAKYLDEHPCLCTSRFRHTLHLLEGEQHRRLATLCHSLQKANLASPATETRYSFVVKRIFEFEALAHSNDALLEASDTSREAREKDPLLLGRLEKIFSRLVTDYRAIFAIEDKEDKQRSDDSVSDHFVDHEHRKRHEEEDECPEEIKLMKVAYEDLSLDSPFSSRKKKAPTHGKKAENAKEKSHLATLKKEGDKLATLKTENHLADLVGRRTEMPAEVIRSPGGSRGSSEESPGFPHFGGKMGSSSPCLDRAQLAQAATSASTPCLEQLMHSCQSSSSQGGNSCHAARKRKERADSAGDDEGGRIRPADSKFSRSSSSEVWDESACGFDACLDLQRCQNNKEMVTELPDDDEGIQLACKKDPKGKLVAHRRLVTLSSRTKERADSLKENKDGNTETNAGMPKEEQTRFLAAEESSCDSNISSLSSTTLQELQQSAPPSNEFQNFSQTLKEHPRGKSKGNKKSLCESLSAPSTSSGLPSSSWFSNYFMRTGTADQSGSPDSSSSSSDVSPGNPEPSPRNSPIVATLVDHGAEHQPVSWTPSTLRRECPSTAGAEDSDFQSRNLGLHRYMDPTHMAASSQRRASDPETLRRSKLKQLKRQLSNVRKKLEEMEEDFEKNQGYRPSHADKQSIKPMRRLLSESSQLKRQIRNFRNDDGLETFLAVKEDSKMEAEEGGNSNNNSKGLRDLEAMRGSLLDIESQLRAQRKMKGRPADLEEMTAEQLVNEKLDLQSSLLRFEATFGHPETTEEKSVTKDIYDRYRTVRRLVRRSSASRSKEQCELATIPEDEAIPFTLASPRNLFATQDNSQEESGKRPKMDCFVGLSPVVSPPAQLVRLVSTSDDEEDESNEDEEENETEETSLHTMSRLELLEERAKHREEKRRLRKATREKEDAFQRETGRRCHKEDRTDAVFARYKEVKANLKLIEVLLSKNKANYY